MMGNAFYFDWEVDLIEWLQGVMGSVGEAIAKVLSVIGGETVSLVVLLQQKSGNALRIHDPRGKHVVSDDQKYRTAPAALYGS